MAENVFEKACLACLVFLSAVLMAQGPKLIRSKHLGIADCDDIAIGPNGDIYLACHSPDDRLAIASKPAKSTRDEMDGYVLRFNPRTGNMIYATRLAGSSYDIAARIKVDREGFAYVAGYTKSRDFLITSGARQKEFAGGDSDAILVKIAPDGSIAYSTFLGGSGTDQGNGIEVDDSGVVIVGGTTWSNDFPGQSKPSRAPNGNAFVALLPNHLDSVRSVVFGGEREEKLTGIVLDRRGGLFTVGGTKSSDFPVTGALQSELNGPGDLFLVRYEVSSLAQTFSTFFGGSGDDSGWGVAVDAQGNPVVAGITDSKDLPASPDAYQRTNRGGSDAFLAGFRGVDFREVRATYFGGSQIDESGYDGQNVRVDDFGYVWMVGITTSRDLPTRNASQSKYGGGNGDGLLAAFSPDLNKLCFSTYSGGADRDLLEGVAVSNSIFVTGLTFSHERRVSVDREPVSFAGKFVNATVFEFSGFQSGNLSSCGPIANRTIERR